MKCCKISRLCKKFKFDSVNKAILDNLAYFFKNIGYVPYCKKKHERNHFNKRF